MQVIADILEDEVEVTKDGVTATRVFKVLDVEAGTPAAMIAYAVMATGIPRRGEPHPGIAGLRADRIRARAIPETTDGFIVTVAYATPDGSGRADEPGSNFCRVSIGTSIVSVETNQDHEGNPILLNHVFRDKETGEETYTAKDQPGRVEKSTPVMVLRFERKELHSPVPDMLAYVGRVNRETLWGAGPREWLCTGISGDSPDGGITYNVTYEFQKNPDGSWDKTVFAYNPATDEIAVDAVEGKGRKTVQLYPPADFAALRLTTDESGAGGGNSVVIVG